MPGLTRHSFVSTNTSGQDATKVRKDNWNGTDAHTVTIDSYSFQGRLTLASGTPITTTAQTAKTTIYATPFLGRNMTLWDGSKWVDQNFSELSIAIPNTTNTPFDILINSSGLSTSNWASTSARTTDIVITNGLYTLSGDQTKLYLGTGCTGSVAGQCEVSDGTCYLWNYFNRRPRTILINDATVLWTYSIDTWRQANGSTANQFNFVMGIAEDELDINILSTAVNDTAVIIGGVGIGFDTTSTDSSIKRGHGQIYNLGLQQMNFAQKKFYPTIGQHYCAWLEKVAATGITTWVGVTAHIQSGITGVFYA